MMSDNSMGDYEHDFQALNNKAGSIKSTNEDLVNTLIGNSG